MSKSKYLDLAGLTVYDGKIKEWIKSCTVDITEAAIRALFTAVQPNNEIWYTSSDGNIVSPSNTSAFGANVVSNTYENGKGVITFDGDIKWIGEGAFFGCSGLTSITIPNSVTSIGDFAFMESALTSIVIPDSVTSIGDTAFGNCNLSSVTIGSGVTSIGSNAFVNCSLTCVTIPNSVTDIRWSAFESCSSLTSITYEGTIEQWNTISKRSRWNYNVPATYVQCSDGQVEL